MGSRVVAGSARTIGIADEIGSQCAIQLSRSPKLLQQLSEPEVFGCHAGLATCLLWRQHQNPGCGIGGEGTNMPAVIDVGRMEVVMHR
jgi:hypothetical protein